MRPVIHSSKHYRQITLSNALASARNIEVLAITDEAPTGITEVAEGAIIKAVYVELWLLDQGNDGANIVCLLKGTAGSPGPTQAEMAALGSYNEKKNVFFVHQGLSGNDAIGNPIVVMQGWYKIPKSKQRFGLGDQLSLVISNLNPGSALNYCGFATYKEYT